MTTSSDFESGSGGGNMEQPGGLQQEAKEQISDLADTAKKAAGQASENAKHIAEDQKQQGAARIDHLASAVHSAADELGKEIPQAASYVHSGADRLRDASRMLRDRSLGDLVKMANDWAHERPVAFAAGSMAAGFVLARFLRSSASAHNRSPAP